MVSRLITLAALLAVLAIGSAKADMFLPPAEYDHPYTGKLTVKTISDRVELQIACNPPFKMWATACALRGPDVGTCTIYLLDDYKLRQLGKKREDVMRHEIGHCNGWGADHAGGIRIPTTAVSIENLPPWMIEYLRARGAGWPEPTRN